MNDVLIKPIVWVGSSYDDLIALPREVQNDIGYALWIAQTGGKHDQAKPLRGFAGVMEIVSRYQTDTYRAVYVVNLDDRLYVLHTFQKKSTRGIATPKKELATIARRLRQAKIIAEERTL